MAHLAHQHRERDVKAFRVVTGRAGDGNFNPKKNKAHQGLRVFEQRTPRIARDILNNIDGFLKVQP